MWMSVHSAVITATAMHSAPTSLDLSLANVTTRVATMATALIALLPVCTIHKYLFYFLTIIITTKTITIMITITITITIMIMITPRLRSSTKQDIALMNQAMFLKFILDQDMFRMKHHPSSVVQ